MSLDAPRGDRRLVVMQGIPGSGKSTRAHAIAAAYPDSSAVYSTDDFFMENGVYMFDPAKLGAAHQWNLDRAVGSMRDGLSCVVIDNTNTRAEHVAPYVEAATEHGYAVEYVRVDPGIEECKRRNATRTADRRIPDEVIDRMHAQLEDLTAVRVFYHVAASEHRQTLFREGLRDRGTSYGAWPPGVYLWGCRRDAENYRAWLEAQYEKPYDIYVVKLPPAHRLRADPWFADDGGADDDERARWGDSWITDRSISRGQLALFRESQIGAADPDRQAADAIRQIASMIEVDGGDKLRDDLLALHRRYTDRYGSPQLGRLRAVYFDSEKGLCYKLPLTEDGLGANSYEASWDNEEIPLADCRLFLDGEGWPVLEMEIVSPTSAPYEDLPDWVGSVDCGQVGYTRDGRLVAYDL